MKFTKSSNIIRIQVDTFIINLYFGIVIDVVIHHHFFAANYGDAAYFAGIEPAQVKMGSHLVLKFQVHVGYIMHFGE